jgi:amino acid transporter
MSNERVVFSGYILWLSGLTSEVTHLSIVIAFHLGLVFLASALTSATLCYLSISWLMVFCPTDLPCVLHLDFNA